MVSDFWKRVDIVVRHRKLSLAKLWALTGISNGTGNGWRVQKRYPDAESLVKIARALDVSVEWLMSEEDLPDVDDDGSLDIEAAEIISGRGDRVTKVSSEEETVAVPIYAQKLSAGRGELFSDQSDIKGQVRVPLRMVKGIERSRLAAAEVKGDSMTGVQIFPGDLVIFAQGAVDEGDGLYVVALGDSVLVKRVGFNPIDNTVTIASENPKYEPVTVPASSDNVRLCGKVVGWLHSAPM